MTQLRTNENGLIHLLTTSFQSNLSFVGELAQNARRSGASFVSFAIDETPGGALRSLTIQDDGAGIENFEALLTVGESGWSDLLKDAEKPFGVGFLSALAVADHLRVESAGRCLSEETARILALKPVTLTDGALTAGTRITLTGLNVTVAALRSQIEHIARGFPIEVYLDGQTQMRPDRFTPDFESCMAGRVRVPWPLEGPALLRLYLQGGPIGTVALDSGLSRSSTPMVVPVHLADGLFSPRMPDRSHLLNSAEAHADIADAYFWAVERRARRALAEGDLSGLQASYPALLDYAVRSKERSARLLSELINDLPFIPASRVALAGGELTPRRRVFDGSGAFITRAELESLTLINHRSLGTLDVTGWTFECDEVDQFDAYLGLVYAKAAGAHAIQTQGLPENHWVYALPGYRSQPPAVASIAYTKNDERTGQSADFEPVYGRDFTIALVESVVMDGDLGPVTFDDIAVVPGPDADAVWFPKSATERDLLLQIDPYEESGGRFDEHALYNDARSLADLVSFLLAGDGAAYLSAALNSMGGLHRSLLSGRSFVVSISDAGLCVEDHAVAG